MRNRFARVFGKYFYGFNILVLIAMVSLFAASAALNAETTTLSNSCTPFSVPLQVACNSHSYTRTFGADPSGTDGYDAGLDLTSPPPGFTYYAYLYISSVPYYLDTDIRSCSDSLIIWTLRIANATGLTSTISWDPEDLPPEGSFQLDGIDMRTDTLATFENDQTLYITYSRLYEIEIPLSSICGWHLVSVPVIPENNDPNAVFPGNCGVYTWNGSSYIVPTAIQPGVSYWVCYIDSVVITVAGTPVTSYVRALTEGWDMIGSTTENVDFTNPNDNPDGSVIDGSLFWFDPSTCAYVAATIIEATKGYWVSTLNNCQLTVSNAK